MADRPQSENHALACPSRLTRKVTDHSPHVQFSIRLLAIVYTRSAPFLAQVVRGEGIEPPTNSV